MSAWFFSWPVIVAASVLVGGLRIFVDWADKRHRDQAAGDSG